MSLAKKLISVSPKYLFKEFGRRYRLKFRPEWHGDGKAGLPYSVSFWLTRRCNLKCSMCFVDTGSVDERPELNVSELCAVLDDLANWKPRIGITGGEPLLRREVVDFITYAKRLGLKVGLNTNAVLIDEEYASALVAAGLDNLTVSVDGPADVHDAIRGKPGLFERAVTGIRNTYIARKRAGRIRPILRITCTVTRENQSRLVELGELASDPELGLEDLGIQHLWFIPPDLYQEHQRIFKSSFGQESPNLNGFVMVDPGIEVENLIKTLVLLRKSCHIPIVENPSLTDNDIRRYYSEVAPVLAKPCYSRFLRMEINPYGDVTPCLSYVAGNVRNETARTIWNNNRYRAFRTGLIKVRYFPGCLRCCGLFSD